jgi:C4-dicarboxylate-specific signal transduction histidine kinase
VIARVRTDDASDRAAPLVRLVAGYMAAFAVALAFLAYVALTRLIVRPVEGVARAADRVATAGRVTARVQVPKSGAREIAELGESVEAMATRLLANESALRKKVDELEAATKSLTETQTQLVRSERLASVGRLAAGVAHEIGNPIAAIMGMEDLLLEGGLTPEEQEDFLRRMKKETERINMVLRDLLDFARPERAEPPSSSGAPSASVATATEDVVALVRTQKAMKGAALDAAIDASHSVRMTQSRLVQVLLNLALNAADAMEEVPEAKRRLTIASAIDGDHVRIEVSDTGPGIAASIASRLFEPFVTTKEPGQGTGLGLAVCRGIVESAGGTIELDARYTDGARFVVRIPTDKPTTKPPRLPASL